MESRGERGGVWRVAPWRERQQAERHMNTSPPRDSGTGKVEIDEEQAAVVRRIFELYVNGAARARLR
jgi:hypothetical protein